jgi:hypothetical protein
MRGLISGAILIVIALAFAGCSSSGGGNPVLTVPGNPDGAVGDFFLPQPSIADSGVIALTDGAVGTTAVTVTETGSGATVTVPAATRIASLDPIYDTDSDDDVDYVVVTLRPLAVHAAQSVAARDAAGGQAGGGNFYKIGGITVLPMTAQTNTPVSVTIPVNAAGAPVAGKSYELYRWVSTWDGPLDDASGSPGYWAFVKAVTVDSNGTSVTFTTSQFGQYAVVTRTVTAPAPPPATT